MLRLTGNWLRVLKIVHVSSACCWLGAGLVLLVLTYAKLVGWVGGDAVYGVDLASRIADEWVVVNMGAFTCLGTALIYGTFTGWGFFKHRWIIVKWAAIIACIVFGMWLGGREGEMLALSREMGARSLNSQEYRAAMNQYGIGVIIQVVVIIAVIAVSIFRPWTSESSRVQPRVS